MTRLLRDESFVSMFVIVLLIVALIAAVVWFGVKSEQSWRIFAQEHNCKVIEKVAGETQTGMIYNDGKPMAVTSYKPGKTVWICDDGVRYTR